MSARRGKVSEPVRGRPEDGGRRRQQETSAPQQLKQRAQFRWLVVNLCFNLIAINVDNIALGDHFDLALTIRLFLSAIALHLTSSNLALRSFVTGAATVAFIATVTGLAQFANDAFSSRYLMIATFMLFVAILFSGLRWRATQATACIAFIVYAVLAVINVHLKIVYANIDLISLCGSTASLALVLRRRQDRQIKEIFAMREIDAIRVRELNEANTRLAQLSNTDPLTGLANRRYLDTVIDGFATSLAPQSSYGVLMIDIDHFKQLNDCSGHAEGDRCLCLVAAVIRNGVRSAQDTAVRYGGEEFAMVLHDAGAHETRVTAERLRQAVADLKFPNPGSGADGFVTVSIGAHVAMPAEDVAEALAKADKVLYDAKQSGRNRVSITPQKRADVIA